MLERIKLIFRSCTESRSFYLRCRTTYVIKNRLGGVKVLNSKEWEAVISEAVLALGLAGRQQCVGLEVRAQT